MLRAYIQGQGIDCGCFGVGEAISPKTLLRDGSMLAAAVLLTVGAFVRQSRAGFSLRGAASPAVADVNQSQQPG